MKVAIALCFLTVLCTVYAFPSLSLEKAKLQVKNAVSSVDLTIQRIERVRSETKEDTILTVTHRWWDQMDNYRKYVNLLSQSMRREVNNAMRFRGVSAEHCYNTNIMAINTYASRAYESSAKCQENAEKSIEKSLKFLNSLTLLGEDLITELNNIIVNCFDDDDTRMQTCILSELAKTNVAVEEFKENAKYIEYSAIPASNYVVIQATQCLTNVYLLARFESQGAMQSNSRCVQNAVKNQNENSLSVLK